jgi:F0F1-type ATP synthase epsilon subunit
MAFKCLLATPATCLIDTDIWQVTVPGIAGRFSIRTGHAPIVASLINGIVEVALSEENRKRFLITSGILEHKNNQCSIICDHAESVE